MILCIGATPAAQRVMVFRTLAIDAVNRALTTLDGVAGKSINVAKVLKVLGAEPVATGFLGGDRGDHLKSIFTSKGIESRFIKVDSRTRECVTVIDESAGTQTELVEESQPVPKEAYDALLEQFQFLLPRAKAVVMSGTLTPGAPEDFYRICTTLAKEAGVLAILDAKGAPLEAALASRPDLVKPNRPELAATVGRELTDDADLVTAMRELHDRGARRVVVTAGKHPTLAFDGAAFWSISGPSIKAVNPIGSGDSFTAALTWRLVHGDSLGEACRWGTAAGIANALTLMAGELTRADVERLAGQVTVERR